VRRTKRTLQQLQNHSFDDQKCHLPFIFGREQLLN
jgi:hypothetical protein